MAPYRRQEPTELDLEPETPLLFEEILDLHRDTFGFGLAEFATLLCAKPLELVSKYGLGEKAAETRSRLRLVRSDKAAAG